MPLSQTTISSRMSNMAEPNQLPAWSLGSAGLLEDKHRSTGRHMLGTTNNDTFKWAMVAIGCTVGALVILAVLIAIVTKCGKRSSAKVQPDFEKGTKVMFQEQQIQQPVLRTVQEQQHMYTPPPPAMPPPAAVTMSAAPPWEQYGTPPPGIMLAPAIPPSIQPYLSNPRPPSAPTYERLVLVSSRVHQPMEVAKSVLPNVAVVVYDWKNFTLQELLQYIKKVLGSCKVTSIAVVAPGNKPGCVALLEDNNTSSEKLAQRGELAQFWRVLAGFVAPNGVNDGRRIDLLGCRVVEAPKEGAALLKELWRLTAVPFAAADDALAGYMLSTFLEEPHSGQLSIISSTIRGIDLYFNKYTLLGIQPPVGGQPSIESQMAADANGQFLPPLPQGLPPPTALQQAAGNSQIPFPLPMEHQQHGYAAPAATTQAGAVQAGAPPLATSAATMPPARTDIFTRFRDNVRAQSLSVTDLYKKYDADRNGWLGPEELVKLVVEVVPDATQLDALHFRTMIDLDGNMQISQQEFMTALEANTRVSSAVLTGRDDNMLMGMLHEYLTDNDEVVRSYFDTHDNSRNGSLDHSEVSNLVSQIPGLQGDEIKFIISYMYQYDSNRDGYMSFDEVKALVRAFGKPAVVHHAKAVPAAPASQPGHQAQAPVSGHHGQMAPPPPASAYAPVLQSGTAAATSAAASSPLLPQHAATPAPLGYQSQPMGPGAYAQAPHLPMTNTAAVPTAAAIPQPAPPLQPTAQASWSAPQGTAPSMAHPTPYTAPTSSAPPAVPSTAATSTPAAASPATLPAHLATPLGTSPLPQVSQTSQALPAAQPASALPAVPGAPLASSPLAPLSGGPGLPPPVSSGGLQPVGAPIRPGGLAPLGAPAPLGSAGMPLAPLAHSAVGSLPPL